MKNKSRIMIIAFVILITIVICIGIVYKYTKIEEDNKKSKDVKITSNIDKFGYVLTDTDTDYYKELFNKLKAALDKDPIDDELYANLVSQLFITDFYTLSNKLSSSDVGGLEFFYSESKDNFALKAKDTIYKSVKTNLYNDREQELPTVTKVSIDSFITTSYSYNELNDDNAYSVKASVTYASDLGYPESVKLILVHNGEKIEVIKVN